MEDFEFINGGIELVDLVQPQWEKLNKYHEGKSTYFAKRYKNFTFEVRKEKFIKQNILSVNIDLIKASNKYIGYCITTINNELTGEIDSLFISEEYRRLGLGDKLMTKALEWLDKNNAKEKLIGVAEGNENVLEFYKKYGFFKRMIILQQI